MALEFHAEAQRVPGVIPSERSDPSVIPSERSESRDLHLLSGSSTIRRRTAPLHPQPQKSFFGCGARIAAPGAVLRALRASA